MLLYSTSSLWWKLFTPLIVTHFCLVWATRGYCTLYLISFNIFGFWKFWGFDYKYIDILYIIRNPKYFFIIIFFFFKIWYSLHFFFGMMIINLQSIPLSSQIRMSILHLVKKKSFYKSNKEILRFFSVHCSSNL